MFQLDLRRLTSAIFGATPPEVLATIFSDQSLNSKDIKSLRLTCKELHPTATREYAERYLTEPFFILSRYSLNSLVDICKHPVISPHVRVIGIVANTLHIRGLRERVCRVEEKISDYSYRVDHMAREIARISEYAKICKEQVELESSGEARKLLLSALSALRHSFAITITNDVESMGPIKVIGLPSSIYHDDRWFGKRSYKMMDRDPKMKSLFKLVQEALAEMSLEDRRLFTALELIMRRRSQMPKPSDGYQDHIAGLQNINWVYSGLKTFQLDMDLQALQSQESFISLDHLFRAAPNLQELSLTAGCSGKRAVGAHSLKRITKLFDIQTKFELRVLDLQEVACTLEALLTLMQRHKQTLTDIKLTKVALLGSWKDCLTWMHQNHDLENFHLEQAYTVDRNKIASKGGSKPTAQDLATASFKGKQSTRDGLDNLIRRTSS
ncbi:hypothetical protein KCU77_g1148, partial [Aureobasidium melanogenum]